MEIFRNKAEAWKAQSRAAVKHDGGKTNSCRLEHDGWTHSRGGAGEAGARSKPLGRRGGRTGISFGNVTISLQ